MATIKENETQEALVIGKERIERYFKKEEVEVYVSDGVLEVSYTDRLVHISKERFFETEEIFFTYENNIFQIKNEQDDVLFKLNAEERFNKIYKN